MPTQDTHQLALIFTIAVVASIIVQMLIFAFFVFTVSKTLKKLSNAADALSSKATPLVTTVRELVDELSPKVRKISSHIEEIAETVKDQTQHVNSTVADVVDKTHVQAAKVDDMVSAVLGSIAYAGAAVQSGVAKPVRQVNGVLNGLRVGLETLIRSETRTKGTVPVPVDSELVDTGVPVASVHPPVSSVLDELGDRVGESPVARQ